MHNYQILLVFLVACGGNTIPAGSVTSSSSKQPSVGSKNTEDVKVPNSTVATNTLGDLPPRLLQHVQKTCVGCHDGFIWRRNVFPKKLQIKTLVEQKKMPKSEGNWGIEEKNETKRQQLIATARKEFLESLEDLK